MQNEEIANLPTELQKHLVISDFQNSIEDLLILEKYLNKDIPAKKFEENLELYSNIFINILRTINEVDDYLDLTSPIMSIIELLAVTDKKNNKCGSILYIEFLRDLNKNTYNEKSNELVTRYIAMKDIIEHTKFIFTLKKDNKHLFPINDIILNLVKNFNVDSDNLINLAISLQFYNIANSYLASKDGNIEGEIKRISENYNIKFLKYLLDGGELINLNDDNFYENGTLIFKKGNNFLIRNRDKSYFNNGEQLSLENEKDSSEEPIAYFVEKKYKENYILKSFSQVMFSDDFSTKQNVLNYILNKKAYNVFIESSILLNENTKEFIGLVNPYTCNDFFIINTNNKKRNIKESNLNNFFEILNDNKEGYRKVILAKKGINILSLNFLTSFYLEVIKDENDFPEIDYNADKILQNEIIENYFHKIFNKNNKALLIESITSFYNFLNNYLFEINENTRMTDIKGIVFPYKLPLESLFISEMHILKTTFFEENIAIENFSYKEIELVNGIDVYYRARLEGKEYSNLLGYNLENEMIDIEEIELVGSKFYGLVNLETKEFYYDKQLMEFYKKLQRMFQKLNASNFLLDYSIVNEIDSNKFNKIATIIYNVGLDNINYKVIDENNMLSHEDKIIIIYFKLICHFHIFSWDKEKISCFFKLILDKHFIGSAYQFEGDLNRWVDSINKYFLAKDTLVIRKGNDRNQGTLDHFISYYCNRYNDRTILYQSKEEDILRNLEENHGLVYYNNEVKKIVFLTDNIMSGTSTINMLKFYLEKDFEDQHNQYIAANTISKYVVKDNLDIIVSTIWGYEIGKENIVKYNSKIQVDIGNVIPDNFVRNDEVIQYLKVLYPEEKIDYKNLPDYLLIRANNMPAKTIYNNKFFNTKMLIGLFNRKNEVSKI